VQFVAYIKSTQKVASHSEVCVAMAVEFGCNNRGKPTIIYRNFEYFKQCDNVSETTSRRCRIYQRIKCKARLITSARDSLIHGKYCVGAGEQGCWRNETNRRHDERYDAAFAVFIAAIHGGMTKVGFTPRWCICSFNG